MPAFLLAGDTGIAATAMVPHRASWIGGKWEMFINFLYRCPAIYAFFTPVVPQ